MLCHPRKHYPIQNRRHCIETLFSPNLLQIRIKTVPSGPVVPPRYDCRGSRRLGLHTGSGGPKVHERGTGVRSVPSPFPLPFDVGREDERGVGTLGTQVRLTRTPEIRSTGVRVDS